MVLESLVSPADAKRNPLKIALLSAVFVSIAVVATLCLGTQQSSLLLVLFVVVPSVPLILKLFSFVEADIHPGKLVAGSRTLARHLPVLMVLVAYFVGLTAGFTFWFLVLPQEDSQNLFEMQLHELKAIQTSFQGQAIKGLMEEFNAPAFEMLFLHNLQVLLIIVVLSLLYGAGAVFVLVWNASVIAVFLCTLARSLFPAATGSATMLTGLGVGVLGILPHGLFELLAYLTTALAGGIISQSVVSKTYKQTRFTQVVYDVAKLFAWAIVFLAIGALIESTAVPIS